MEYKDQVPGRAEIGVCEKYYNDAKFIAYHERYLLSKIINGYNNMKYVIVNIDCEPDSISLTRDRGFSKISPETSEFHLYIKGK